MDFKKIEKKWQKKWEETNLYAYKEDKTKEKLYCLESFSYPSGAKLHLGRKLCHKNRNTSAYFY